MAKEGIAVLGEKETFIIRVLVKKLVDAGLPAVFVPATVDNINKTWDDYNLVTYYMESQERIPGDVLSFLSDKLRDSDRKIILIGEPDDTRRATDRLPGDHVHKVFARPLDNALFIDTVSQLLNQLKEGEFKKKIMIVDDDASYMNLIRDWLKNTYKVYMANSGMQAIKLVSINKVDLILLDHEMPVTTGPQVLEMLRSEEETRNIPVIFLTGKGDKESVMQVVALKPEGYFLKTVKKDELLEKLKEFFERRV